MRGSMIVRSDFTTDTYGPILRPLLVESKGHVKGYFESKVDIGYVSGYAENQDDIGPDMGYIIVCSEPIFPQTGPIRAADIIRFFNKFQYNFSEAAMEFVKNPVNETWQLHSGDAVIPLKRTFPIYFLPHGSLYSIDFDVEIPAEEPRSFQHKILIRKFLKLEQKATRGILTDDEKRIWSRICDIVDQDKLFLLRERKSPNRYKAKIIEGKNGRRKVKFLTGLEFDLSDNSITALEFLDKGDWFEAGMIIDSNQEVIEIHNVILRSEPHIPTDEEIDNFFKSKQIN